MNKVNVDYLKKYTFIEKIKQLPYVEKVILFGSRARGTQSLRSDIDIAIVCPLATKTQWLELLAMIDNADTLLSIDCVNFDTMDDELKARIIIDGITL